MGSKPVRTMRGDTGFGLGFFCGALLGAVSVYITVTPEGKAFKERFLREYRQSKDILNCENDKGFVSERNDQWMKICADAHTLLDIIRHKINRHPAVLVSKIARGSNPSDKKKHYFKAKLS